MDDLLLLVERCVDCEHLFWICRRCYRGQTYCGDRCRGPARAEQAKTARAKHQKSPRGRRAHSIHNRDLRRRKRAALIIFEMDQGSELLAPTSSVCLPQGSLAPMDGVPAAEGRSSDDDHSTDGDPYPLHEQRSGVSDRDRAP